MLDLYNPSRQQTSLSFSRGQIQYLQKIIAVIGIRIANFYKQEIINAYSHPYEPSLQCKIICITNFGLPYYSCVSSGIIYFTRSMALTSKDEEKTNVLQGTRYCRFIIDVMLFYITYKPYSTLNVT